MNLTPHVRGAAFMVGAVVLFSVSDTLTKLITTNIPITTTLFVRAFFALLFVYVISLFFKIGIPRGVFRDGLLVIRSAFYVITVGLFASGLKLNTFTAFYVVFFLNLPVAAFTFDYLVYGRKPRKSTIPCIITMLLGVIIVNYENIFDIFALSAFIAAAAAWSYSGYLVFSTYINSRRNNSALAQNAPNFFYGAIILFFMSLLSSDDRVGFTVIFSDHLVLLLIASAGCVTSIALVLLDRASSYAPAGEIAPYEYVIVVYALFVDNFIFKNAVTLYTISGSVIVLIGAILLVTVAQKRT